MPKFRRMKKKSKRFLGVGRNYQVKVYLTWSSMSRKVWDARVEMLSMLNRNGESRGEGRKEEEEQEEKCFTRFYPSSAMLVTVNNPGYARDE